MRRFTVIVLALLLAVGIVGLASNPDSAAAPPPVHVHSDSGPIAALHHSTLERHALALEVGQRYRHVGMFALRGEGPLMPPDTSGNTPPLYSDCEECQNGTIRRCTDDQGVLVDCKCHCGYNNLCYWIRYYG